jgi:hypothetical protein
VRHAVVRTAIALGVVLAGARAFAQAWMPPRGVGSVTIAAQTIDNTAHVDATGHVDPGVQSRDTSIYLETEYAVTDRWSFTVGIPFVFSRVTQKPPITLPIPSDNCQCWQHAWQDFGLTARYSLLNGRTALTPSVSYGVPSHDYPYQGEAVPGRHLQELRLAVDVGRRLDAISPRLAVQGQYSYAFVAQVLDIPNNRSNGSVAVNYQLVPSLSVQGTLMGQVTHGGLRVVGPPPLSPGDLPWGQIETVEQLVQHDRILNDDNWRAGMGATYHAARADVFFSYLGYAGGRNSHQGRAFTVGVNVPFGQPPPPQ